jgi:RHS repeat-associated protein
VDPLGFLGTGDAPGNTGSQLMYYRNRMYHADLGRFVSRDPVGYRDGLNCYAYVAGNPSTFTDPTGKHRFSDCFPQFDHCEQIATANHEACYCLAKGWLDRIWCDVLYDRDMVACNAEFIACILSSEEVRMGLLAGAISVTAVLAVVEPTPLGEAALVSLLISAGVIEPDGAAEESPQ